MLLRLKGGSMTNEDWKDWRRHRILELQRERRRMYPRIDYYPSKEALAAINARCGNYPGGDYSSVINRLVEDATE